MEDGRRRTLVEAMARACFERGYTDTTIEDLLRETGLGREEFERHFADKEDCAVAAVEVVLGEGLAIVSRSFAGDTAESESALRSLFGLLEFFAEEPAFASLALVDSRQRLPRSAHARYAAGFAILIAMLDRLRTDNPAGVEPPPCAAKAGIGGAEALIRRELAHGRAASLPGLVPDLIYSALVPFVGQTEALRIRRQARNSRELDEQWF